MSDHGFNFPEHDRILTRATGYASAALTLALAIAFLALTSRYAGGTEVGNQWDSYRQSPLPGTLPKAATGRAFAVSSVVGGAPYGCPPRRYCGCALALKLFGQPRRDLWPARAWLKIGRPVPKPYPGVVAVYRRGKTGGHVGLITAVNSPRSIVMWSANDGGATRVRERSTAGVIGYRKI